MYSWVMMSETLVIPCISISIVFGPASIKSLLSHRTKLDGGGSLETFYKTDHVEDYIEIPIQKYVQLQTLRQQRNKIERLKSTPQS